MIGINIVVRNEEKRLSVLLPLLREQLPTSEIVLVDQESTDGTVDIAKKFCDKVIPDKATGIADTSRALCMDNTTSPWILTIDADEFLTNRLARDIPELIKDDVDGFLIHHACLREPVSLEHILEFGDTVRNYKHDSFPMRYRLYRHGRVNIPGRLHSGVGPFHYAKTRYLQYNGIVEYKTAAEQQIDLVRYTAVAHGYYDKNIHI